MSVETLRWLMRRRPRHFAVGPADYQGTACGIAGWWHRGLDATRTPANVTCKHCLRWMRKRQAPEPMKNVTPG